MGTRALVAALEAQARETRGWTLALVNRAPDEWLYRRVAWTDCTLAWHMAHLAILQDVYAHSFLGVATRPDEQWRALFGDGAQPQDTAAYPPPAEVPAAFDAAQTRFPALLATLDDADLARPVANAEQPGMTTLRGIIRVLMHEAEHFAGLETLLLYYERLEASGVPIDHAPAAVDRGRSPFTDS